MINIDDNSKTFLVWRQELQESWKSYHQAQSYQKFRKIHRKTFFFVAEACKFIRKTPAQVLSCKCCEISKNTFFTEHLWTTVSGPSLIEKCPSSCSFSSSFEWTTFKKIGNDCNSFSSFVKNLFQIFESQKETEYFVGFRKRASWKCS